MLGRRAGTCRLEKDEAEMKEVDSRSESDVQVAELSLGTQSRRRTFELGKKKLKDIATPEV